jgi:hypothetical protein
MLLPHFGVSLKAATTNWAFVFTTINAQQFSLTH